MIPYGKQDIDQSDIDAVIEVLRSDFLTTGPRVSEFEQAIAAYCQVDYAVAVANATAALHLACLALGVGEGDMVWTSPNTFVASANCALYCGARVDFVDICPKTYNMSADALEAKLKLAKEKGCLPKAVIPVHFAGQSCDMRRIKALSDAYGFYIVEDASHAIGGRYQDKPIGCCEYSDITVLSFHPVKVMTTGEGGMVLTNNSQLADNVRLLRTHGIVRKDLWRYEQIDLGFNYRITDIQCALGISQLKRLNHFIECRHKLVERYEKLLADFPLILPTVLPGNYSAYHLYVVQIDAEKTKISRTQLFEYLRERGIGVNVHYIPVHTQPYYKKLGFSAGQFPVAEQYYAQALTIPLYSKLTFAEQDQVVAVLNEAFSKMAVSL